MKAINAPTQTTVPFAASGTKNTIPVPSQQGTTPGAASMTDGFPPQTMQPIASGGIPPFGADMNGILNQLSAAVQWAQAGGQFPFNATFAAAIGGYPAGALVLNAAGTGQWLNTVDQNSTNPDASGAAGWVAVRANSGVASLTATSGNVTPTAAQLAAQVISVTGTLTANAAVVLPLAAGATWIVANNTTGSFTLAVNGATGTGVTIPQGSAIGVYSDGTNFYATSASVTGQYLPIDGTAVAATKLATARAFNLTGPVTAAAQNFDGTGNVTLTTAVADGAFTIAKTSGLQTALDGKLSLGGGTITGNLAITGSLQTIGQINIASSGEADLFMQYGGSAAHRVYMSINSSGWGLNFTDGAGSFAGQAMTMNTTTGVMSFGLAPFFQAGIRVSAGATAASNGQGAYMGWNKNTPSTNGETDFINHKGGGTGGFAWWNTDGTTYTLLGELLPGGVLRVVNTGANPSTPNLFALRGDGPYGGGVYLNDPGGGSSWGNYCVAGSLLWSSGAVNGGALAQRMILSSSGNLTVTGTGNFQGSDIRFKRDIKRSAARPIHRGLHIHDYKMIASGEAGRGVLAQDMLPRAKEYVSSVNIGTEDKPTNRLTINYAGTALEIALWAANEVDRINARARWERWVIAGIPWLILAGLALARVL